MVLCVPMRSCGCSTCVKELMVTARQCNWLCAVPRRPAISDEIGAHRYVSSRLVLSHGAEGAGPETSGLAADPPPPALPGRGPRAQHLKSRSVEGLLDRLHCTPEVVASGTESRRSAGSTWHSRALCKGVRNEHERQ